MKEPGSFNPKGRSGGRDLLRGKDLKYIYSGLWGYLSQHKPSLALAVALTFVSSILGITGTSLAGTAIGAIAGEAPKGVFYYLVLMVICYTVSAVVSYVHSVLMIKISQKMAAKMRADVYDKLITLLVRMIMEPEKSIIMGGTYRIPVLAKLLNKHPIFSTFGIIDVSGNNEDANTAQLAVENAIKTYKHTITLSCGRLTRGITIPQ